MKAFSIAYGFFIALACLQCAQAPHLKEHSPPDIIVFDRDELEQAIHQRVNKERAKKRLSALEWNNRLSRVAKNHSEDMLRNNYFAHTSQDGRSPSDRANDAGFECTVVSEGNQRIGIGENLLTTFSYHSYEITEQNGEESIRYNWKTVEELANEAVATWMKSRLHRRNILRADYIQQGIGAVVGKDQKIFITQNFC